MTEVQPLDDATVLDMHSGSVFRDTSDNKYETHAKVIYEAVQNALNAEANEIWVVIDYKNKAISIRDNGVGVTVADFNEKLRVKGMQGLSTGMGFFNLGFTSALGKCEILQFTSKAKEQGAPYVRWTFNSHEIFDSRRGISIPRETLDLSYSSSPKSGSQVGWRSSYEMIGLAFRDKRAVSKPKGKDIRDYCIKSFRGDMLKNNTKMHVKEINAKGKVVFSETFEADAFKGKKLKLWKVSEPAMTKVELYLSNKTEGKFTGQGVTLHRLHDSFGVDALEFLKNCSDSGLLDSKDLVAAIKSGMFEGKIESSLLEILSTRNKFREDDNLLEFLIHLQQWWEEVGMEHYELVRNDESSELFTKCAKDAQNKLKKITEDSDVMKLLDGIKNRNTNKTGKKPVFTTTPTGTVIQDGSWGDYDIPGKRPPRPTRGAHPTKTAKTSNERKVRGGKASGDIKVTGINSRDRDKTWDLKLVESTDLDAETPWFITEDRGKVLVNIEHHYYTRIYENTVGRQKRVVDYQMKVLFQALSLVTSDFLPSDEHWQNMQQVLFQELFLEVLSITS